MSRKFRRKPPIIEAIIASIPLFIGAVGITIAGLHLVSKYIPQAFNSVPVDLSGFVQPIIFIVVAMVAVGFIQRFINIYTGIKRDYNREKKRVKRENKQIR